MATRAAVEGPRACICGGVGIPVNSLKDAPRLLETDVSGTNSDDDWSRVKPVWNGVNCGATTGEDNQWDTCTVGEAN